MRTKGIGLLTLAATAGFASCPRAAAASPREDPAIGVVSAGIADVTPSDGAPLAMVHVRVALANPDPALAWRFDVRSTWIDVGAGATAHVVMANADVETLPIILVEPGTHVVVDLYAVAWPTRLDRLVVRTRAASPDRRYTLVARLATPVAASDASGERGTPVGTASTWWADPAFPWTTFRRASGRITPRAPTGAVVALRPR
jgi:hypothetical protein